MLFEQHIISARHLIIVGIKHNISALGFNLQPVSFSQCTYSVLLMIVAIPSIAGAEDRVFFFPDNTRYGS